jgi:hypothetical protein
VKCCFAIEENGFIAACRPVAQQSPVIIHDLFNLAFYANLLVPPYMRFERLLLDILAFPQTPAHVAIILASLVEFADRAGMPIVALQDCRPKNRAFRLRAALAREDPTELAAAYFDVGMLEEPHQFASIEWSDEAWLAKKESFPEKVIAALNSIENLQPSTKFVRKAFDELGTIGGPQFSPILGSIVCAQILTEFQELSSAAFKVRMTGLAEVFNAIYPILLVRIETKPQAEEEKIIFLHSTCH